MMKSNRIELLLERQRRHLTRDAMYVALLVAATVFGLGAIAL